MDVVKNILGKSSKASKTTCPECYGVGCAECEGKGYYWAWVEVKMGYVIISPFTGKVIKLSSGVLSQINTFS